MLTVVLGQTLVLVSVAPLADTHPLILVPQCFHVGDVESDRVNTEIQSKQHESSFIYSTAPSLFTQ